MSLLAHLDRWWRPSWPAERVATLRVLVGVYGVIWLTARLPHLLSYARDDAARWAPVGVLSSLDAPLSPELYRVLVALTLGLSLAFAAGWRFRVTGPLFAGTLLVVLTHTNSWGKILHTENVWWAHVAALAAGRSADALSLDARRSGSRPGAAPRYGWPVMLMMAAGALPYLLAGIAKLRGSGLAFVSGETLRNYVAFGNVRKLELGSAASALAPHLMDAPGFFTALALLSLVLELTAPLVLVWRRFRKPWVLGVGGFHWGVLALMAIGFPYQLSFVAFACTFEAERLWRWRPLRGLGRRLGSSPSQAHGSLAP